MKLKLNRLIISLALLSVLSGIVQAASAPQQAPDFSTPDIAGKVQTLSSYRGKMVVLNFWATWCPECVHELPSLSAFARSSNDVVVLGIASERSVETVKTFLSSSPVAFPVLLDTNGDIFVKKYMIRALPCTVIVDRKGNIAERLFGAQNFESSAFKDKIRRLREAP